MYDWLRLRGLDFWLAVGLTTLFVVVMVAVYQWIKPPDGCYYVVSQDDKVWRVRTLDYNIGGVSFEGKDGSRIFVSGNYSVREYGCR